MLDKHKTDLVQTFMDAWNRQDVEKVAGCYAEDLAYIDPNTRGEIATQQALRRYLTKLFSLWKMHWSVRDIHVFKDIDGAGARWHATFQVAAGGKVVETDGMDFILFEGDKIKRNEVYFDRTALAALLIK